MFEPTIRKQVEEVGRGDRYVWEIPVFDERMRDAVLEKGTVWLVDNAHSTYEVRSAAVVDVRKPAGGAILGRSAEYVGIVEPKPAGKAETIFGSGYGSEWFLSGREATLYSEKMKREAREKSDAAA